MSITLLRPPRTPSVQTTYGGRRVFTLHADVNRIFAWHLSDERYKTATVAFRRRTDAILMAHVIEHHVIQNREWPDCSVVDQTFKLYSGVVNVKEDTSFVHVQSWQLGSLKEFCAETYLDLVLLDRVTRKDDDTFNLAGQLMTLEYPFEVYANRLENLYGIFEVDDED